MTPPRRRIIGAAILLIAGAGAAILIGGQVGMCLGPFGVTPIQCAKVTGIVPTAGAGLPILAVCTAAAAIVLFPVPSRRRLSALAAGAVSAAAAGLAVGASWDRTWTGVDSAGRTVSVDRPVDLAVAAAAACAGAAVGALVWGHGIPWFAAFGRWRHR